MYYCFVSTFQYKLNLFTYNNNTVYQYARLLGFSKTDIRETLSKMFQTIYVFVLFIPLIFQVICMIMQIVIYDYPLWIVSYVVSVEIIIYLIIYLKIRNQLNKQKGGESL